MNILKYAAFLYINNKISEIQTKKKIPLQITSKRIEIPSNNISTEWKTYTLKIININEGNWKWHKEIKRYPIFMEELIFLKWMKCSYYSKQSTDLM